MQLTNIEILWLAAPAYWVVAFLLFYLLIDVDDTEGERVFLVFATVFWPFMVTGYLFIQPFLFAINVKRKRSWKRVKLR